MYVDPYDAAEVEQDRLQDEKEKASREVLLEHAEEMAYDLKRDGRGESLPLTVGLNKGHTQRANR
jgi:hypothetical protein